jgi:RNA polymerase sigma-70 factor (ECF subfamily)
MAATPQSLLVRLQNDARPEDWQRLVALYAPLLHGWMMRYRVQAADADDLVQEVLQTVVRELAGFRHSGRAGAFRCWLRVIAVHRLRNFWRSAKGRPTVGPEVLEELGRLEDDASDLSRRWDEDHDRHVVSRLLEQIEGEFHPSTWQAFRRVTLDGASAADTAAELGLTPNAVWIAKSRVLNRLRQESAGIIE